MPAPQIRSARQACGEVARGPPSTPRGSLSTRTVQPAQPPFCVALAQMSSPETRARCRSGRAEKAGCWLHPRTGGRSRGRTTYLRLQALESRGGREALAWRPQGAAESRGVARRRDSGDAGRADGRWPAHLGALPVGFTVGGGGLRRVRGQRELGRGGPAFSRGSAGAGREPGVAERDPPACPGHAERSPDSPRRSVGLVLPAAPRRVPAHKGPTRPAPARLGSGRNSQRNNSPAAPRRPTPQRSRPRGSPCPLREGRSRRPTPQHT